MNRIESRAPTPLIDAPSITASGAIMPTCLCGCGQQPDRGLFMPGHDQRYRIQTEALVGGEVPLRQLVEEALRYVGGENSASGFTDAVRRIMWANGETKDE